MLPEAEARCCSRGPKYDERTEIRVGIRWTLRLERCSEKLNRSHVMTTGSRKRLLEDGRPGRSREGTDGSGKDRDTGPGRTGRFRETGGQSWISQK